jgi:precorrin-2 dehydrogenase/sirohydrochlorin ferrochelatase
MSLGEEEPGGSEEYIPLYVNPKGLKVLVVGGGSVGSRRALMFRNAGARVVVVASEFSEILLKAGGVELRKLALPEDLEVLEKLVDESDIVVVALGDEGLAERIASIALAKRKLVNNAVDHRRGNVIVPFSSSIAGLNVAITSFGATGLAARLALEKVVELLRGDREVNAAYKAMGRLKMIIKSTVKDPKARMKAYYAIHEDEEFRSHIRRGDWKSAYLRGLKVIESLGVTLDPSYYIIPQDLQ